MDFNTLAQPLLQQSAEIKPEPTPAPDFQELDRLLEESMEAHTKNHISSQKRKLKTFNIKRQEQAARPFPMQLKSGIEVWEQVSCACNRQTDFLFLRFMEEWVGRDKSGVIRNWKTVEQLDPRLEDTDIRQTLVTREVELCAGCTGIDTSKMEDFNEVVRSDEK